MKAWLQHADFSEQEFDLGIEDALKKYRDIDWLVEWNLEENLRRDGKDCCPPGMGFVCEDDYILHICPHPAETRVHFHYPEKKFGFLKQTKSITHNRASNEEVSSFIQAFYEKDWGRIQRMIPHQS